MQVAPKAKLPEYLGEIIFFFAKQRKIDMDFLKQLLRDFCEYLQTDIRLWFHPSIFPTGVWFEGFCECGHAYKTGKDLRYDLLNEIHLHKLIQIDHSVWMSLYGYHQL